MKGHNFKAAWTQGENGWVVRLDPLKRNGRLPTSGTVLDVRVQRRDQTSQLMQVRVVGVLTDSKGRSYAAWGKPVSEERRTVKARKSKARRAVYGDS